MSDKPIGENKREDGADCERLAVCSGDRLPGPYCCVDCQEFVEGEKMTRGKGARCEPVTMSDGSVMLVRLKPGAELTDEDRKTLSDFHDFLKKPDPPKPVIEDRLEWRYTSDRAKVKHGLWTTSHNQAVCGLRVTVSHFWKGTGSQEEYERVEALPKCSRCVKAYDDLTKTGA